MRMGLLGWNEGKLKKSSGVEKQIHHPAKGAGIRDDSRAAGWAEGRKSTEGCESQKASGVLGHGARETA